MVLLPRTKTLSIITRLSSFETMLIRKITEIPELIPSNSLLIFEESKPMIFGPIDTAKHTRLKVMNIYTVLEYLFAPNQSKGKASDPPK